MNIIPILYLQIPPKATVITGEEVLVDAGPGQLPIPGDPVAPGPIIVHPKPPIGPHPNVLYQADG